MFKLTMQDRLLGRILNVFSCIGIINLINNNYSHNKGNQINLWIINEQALYRNLNCKQTLHWACSKIQQIHQRVCVARWPSLDSPLHSNDVLSVIVHTKDITMLKMARVPKDKDQFQPYYPRQHICSYILSLIDKLEVCQLVTEK